MKRSAVARAFFQNLWRGRAVAVTAPTAGAQHFGKPADGGASGATVSPAAAAATPAAVSECLVSLAAACTLHSCATVQFNEYMCQNQNTKKLLNVIESCRFAVDAVPTAVDPEDQPLVAVFTRLALEEAISAADCMLGVAAAVSLPTVPYPPSPATATIRYVALEEARSLLAKVQAAEALDACVEACLGDVIGTKPSFSVTSRAPAPVKLVGTHPNMLHFAGTVEVAMASLAVAAGGADKTDAAQRRLVAEACADVLAASAALSRASIAMAEDPDGEGRVQWALTQSTVAFTQGRVDARIRAIAGIKSAAVALSKKGAAEAARPPVAIATSASN